VGSFFEGFALPEAAEALLDGPGVLEPVVTLGLQGAHSLGQRGRSRFLQLDSERANLLIEGEQGR
jgi:hypothetical protein